MTIELILQLLMFVAGGTILGCVALFAQNLNWFALDVINSKDKPNPQNNARLQKIFRVCLVAVVSLIVLGIIYYIK